MLRAGGAEEMDGVWAQRSRQGQRDFLGICGSECIQVSLVCSHTCDPSVSSKVSVVPTGSAILITSIPACQLWKALAGFPAWVCFALGRLQCAVVSYISAEK